MNIVDILSEKNPSATLRRMSLDGALVSFLPEVCALRRVEQDPKWHPEGDAFVHTLLVLEQASRLSPDPSVRFAALVHDLGKAATPRSEWPRHIDHEIRGLEIVANLCRRLSVPQKFKELSLWVTENHLRIHRALDMRPGKILDLLLDCEKRGKTFLDDVLVVCAADNSAKKRKHYRQGIFLESARQALHDIKEEICSPVTEEERLRFYHDVGRIKRMLTLSRDAFKNVPNGLSAFLVGGAVRDTLLGLAPKDYDFIVLGETVDSMKKRGYKQVGKDFPVFVDDSGKQFALARKERSTGPGHKDYAVSTDKVSLNDDLCRRDLTINAMALSRTGDLIDPFGGKNDLFGQKDQTIVHSAQAIRAIERSSQATRTIVLRPVGEHFWEDPLRALRVCRQFGKLANAGYAVSVDPGFERELAGHISEGVLSALPGERIFQECLQIFLQKQPSYALKKMEDLGVWKTFLGKDVVIDFLKVDETSDKKLGHSYVFAAFCSHMADSCREALYKTLKVPNAWSVTSERMVAAKKLVGESLQTPLPPDKLHNLAKLLRGYDNVDEFDKSLSFIFSDAKKFLAYKKCIEEARKIDGEKIMEKTGTGPGPEIGKEVDKERLAAIRRTHALVFGLDRSLDVR